MSDFVPFPKIGRLSRNVIVTEKIDGTNAQVVVENDGTVRAGSRTRWIAPEDDNYGFAAWVRDHAVELRALGVGRHFGEWWGRDIQRNYGLTERRFSLFNVGRWGDPAGRPACCHAVPVLGRYTFDTGQIDRIMADLAMTGSHAAPGFMKPEGIVVFHTQTGTLFKKTFEKDDAGKGREPEKEMAA